LDNNSDDTVLGSISAASNASSAVPPPCNDARKNVCLLCRDPDAPCDEITEALINLLMDAMLSPQNLLHALDHFCANHKIVPEFTSIPSTGNMLVAHVDGDWWSPCWTTEGGGGMSMCAYMWRLGGLGDMLRPIHLWSQKLRPAYPVEVHAVGYQGVTLLHQFGITSPQLCDLMAI